MRPVDLDLFFQIVSSTSVFSQPKIHLEDNSFSCTVLCTLVGAAHVGSSGIKPEGSLSLSLRVEDSPLGLLAVDGAEVLGKTSGGFGSESIPPVSPPFKRRASIAGRGRSIADHGRPLSCRLDALMLCRVGRGGWGLVEGRRR